MYRSVNINWKIGGLRNILCVKVAYTNTQACHACALEQSRVSTYMYMYVHSARTHVSEKIAACFTQKEKTLQFLLTSIRKRIISVNACKFAHTENRELDSHAACIRRKEKIIFVGKLNEKY